MEKVSIIIPAYNAGKTLLECYKSIQAQTYKNFEVITINDSSTDETEKVAQEFSQQDDRFFVVTTTKGGVSKARNAGLKRATGGYIQFMDADDTLEADMLEKMVNLIEKNDAELAICCFEHPFFKTYLEDKVYDLSRPYDLLKLYQDPFGLVVPWNKLWKREAITEDFDEDVSFSEDELFNIANLFNVKKVATTKEVLYNYFIAPPEELSKQNSCICRVIRQVENSETAGFYWLARSLMEKQRRIIENGINSKNCAIKNVDELAYHVLINYSIHTLSAYIGMNISKESLIKNYLEILDDNFFLEAFKAQERYGLKLRNLSRTYKLILLNKFFDSCFEIYKSKKDEAEFKISNAYMYVFLHYFAESCGNLITENQNAKLIKEMINQSTKEANFSKEVVTNDFISVDNFTFADGHCAI